MKTSAYRLLRVDLQKNISLMDYSTIEEEEQFRRITSELSELSEKIAPIAAEMHILYRARWNLFQRWKGRHKTGKRKAAE